MHIAMIEIIFMRQRLLIYTPTFIIGFICMTLSVSLQNTDIHNYTSYKRKKKSQTEKLTSQVRNKTEKKTKKILLK